MRERREAAEKEIQGMEARGKQARASEGGKGEED